MTPHALMDTLRVVRYVFVFPLHYSPLNAPLYSLTLSLSSIDCEHSVQRQLRFKVPSV